MFAIIYNLARKGAKEIDEVDVGTFIQNQNGKNANKIRELFSDNNYIDFITTIKDLANQENIDVYYSVVRKVSLIKEYYNQGFDVEEYWDDDKATAKLNGCEIEDIVGYYESKLVDIKKRFYQNKDIEEIKAGKGFVRIKEMFMRTPMFGATTFSDYLNTATRGWIKGQLTIYSMGSGTGKSTIGLANIVKVSCDELWDYKTKQFVKNPCYQNAASLYLQYEMSNEMEITPKLVATISGVPTTNILNGTYENDEEERVDYAIEILNRSEIYLVTMPTFTVGLIENYIKDYVYTKNVQYVVFDYISESASVSSDIAKQMGVQTRSDQVLANIASKLKDIAVETNTAIMSFTQVNDRANTQEILDAGCIAGSRAVQNKCDIAGIMMPLRKNEFPIAELIIQKDKFKHLPFPNRVMHLYKVRFGNEEQNIKIWLNLDLATGEVTDCWVTDKNNEPYEMKKTQLGDVE